MYIIYNIYIYIYIYIQAPNQHNCCATVLWKFLPVLTSLLGKWSI